MMVTATADFINRTGFPVAVTVFLFAVWWRIGASLQSVLNDLNVSLGLIKAAIVAGDAIVLQGRSSELAKALKQAPLPSGERPVRKSGVEKP